MQRTLDPPRAVFTFVTSCRVVPCFVSGLRRKRAEGPHLEQQKVSQECCLSGVCQRSGVGTDAASRLATPLFARSTPSAGKPYAPVTPTVPTRSSGLGISNCELTSTCWQSYARSQNSGNELLRFLLSVPMLTTSMKGEIHDLSSSLRTACPNKCGKGCFDGQYSTVLSTECPFTKAVVYGVSAARQSYMSSGSCCVNGKVQRVTGAG